MVVRGKVETCGEVRCSRRLKEREFEKKLEIVFVLQKLCNSRNEGVSIVAPRALLRLPVPLSTLDVPAPSLCTLSALSCFPSVPSHLSRSHFLSLPFPHLSSLRSPIHLSLCLHSPFPHLHQLVTSSEVRIPPPRWDLTPGRTLCHDLNLPR